MPISLSNTVDFFCADKDICMQICMVKEKTDRSNCIFKHLEKIQTHLTTGVCVVVRPGRCDDECLDGVVDKEGEDAHQQGGHFHHPPHILLPLSPSLHCAAFRGARAAGRPLWPQLLATPAHEADCTRRQRVKLAGKLYQHCI